MLWLIKINCVICHEATLIEENNSSYPNLVAGGKALPIFKDFTHAPHIWVLKVKQGPLDLIVCSLLLLFVMELHSPHIWALKVKQGPLDLSGCSLLLLVVMELHSPHICALKVKQGPLHLIVCSLLLLVVMEPL
jgi:hypothetical protein